MGKVQQSIIFKQRMTFFFFFEEAVNRGLNLQFSPFFSAAVEVALHNFLTIGISWLRSRLVTTPLNQPALSGGKKALLLIPFKTY